MVFLRCGNKFIYVVGVCVRTKSASSAHLPSTEQLRGLIGGLLQLLLEYSPCVHGHCHAGDNISLALG